MGDAFKKVAKVAVTLALGSVLVACGGGQSGSDSEDGTGGGTGITASIEGTWSLCEGGGGQSLKTVLTLSKTGSSQLDLIKIERLYTGLTCEGAPQLGSEAQSVSVLTLQGVGVDVEAVGITPQQFKSVDGTDISWGYIALKDAQTLGYIVSAPSTSTTPSYPTLTGAGTNLTVYTRVVTR